MTGVVEVLGYSIGAIPAGIAFVAVAAAILFALKALLGWLYGVAISLALRHAVYAVISAAGISIHTFVDGGIVSFVTASIEWVLALVGVELALGLVGL